MGNLFDSIKEDIIQAITQISQEIDSLPLEDKIDVINKAKMILHSVSPFSKEPVDCVLWINAGSVGKNDYNPNNVAPPEMKLLKLSIEKDHYTQPIVVWKTNDEFEIIDGEHRSRVGKECKVINERIYNYLPVTIANDETTEDNDRISSTIRHNRARGVHNVMSMTDIVLSMLQNGWDEDRVSTELGMDADEFLRFKQNTGIAALFKNVEYSKAWE